MFIFRPVARTVLADAALRRNAASAQRYTTSDVISTEATGLGLSLSASGATFSSGVLTMFGGRTAPTSGWVSTIRSYTQATQSDVSDSVSLSSSRGGVGASRLSGFSYLFGGSADTGNGGAPRVANSSAIQKHSTGSMSTEGSTLASSLSSPRVATLSSNILIFGGTNSGGTELTSIQRYNGSSRTTDGSSLTFGANDGDTNTMSFAVCPIISGLVWVSEAPGNASPLYSYDGSTLTYSSGQSGKGSGTNIGSYLYWTYVVGAGNYETRKFDGSTDTVVGTSATTYLLGFSAAAAIQFQT